MRTPFDKKEVAMNFGSKSLVVIVKHDEANELQRTYSSPLPLCWSKEEILIHLKTLSGVASVVHAEKDEETTVTLHPDEDWERVNEQAIIDVTAKATGLRHEVDLFTVERIGAPQDEPATPERATEPVNDTPSTLMQASVGAGYRQRR